MTMNPLEKTNSIPNPLIGGDDEVIDLTEVVEEASAAESGEAGEVVLEFSPDREDLNYLKSPAETPEKAQAAPSATPKEESLDDFLASLPDFPEDLDINADSQPAPAMAAPGTPQDLTQRLDDAELKELVRQAVQETVERLARELFPGLASQAIERELNLWKKRLTEAD